jgi:MtN3 and saliva related transmembrane protein
MRHNVRMMFNFLIPLIGILATIFAVSSTVPQIIKGIKTRKMDDVSVWLIMTLIIGLSLWVVYGISKSDVVIAGGNSVGVSLNVILLLLKVKYSRNPVS